MTTPVFKTKEVRDFYESIKQWVHPDYPFVDPDYHPWGYTPAVDMTPFVTDCLLNNRYEPIDELWSYLTGNNPIARPLLKAALSVDLPDWIGLSKTARSELKAINILLVRGAFCSGEDISRVACALAATTISSRRLEISPEHLDFMLKLTASETTSDSSVRAHKSRNDAPRVALELAMSPLGEAEPFADKIKSIPPMARLVVSDYIFRGWGEGLRYCLYYGERKYGCGTGHNQAFVEWLGVFGPPPDDYRVPGKATKAVICDFMGQRGIPVKRTSLRKDLLAQLRTHPGLTKELILQHSPELRVLSSEWNAPVVSWAHRARTIEPVGAAVLKLLAQAALYVK